MRTSLCFVVLACLCLAAIFAQAAKPKDGGAPDAPKPSSGGGTSGGPSKELAEKEQAVRDAQIAMAKFRHEAGIVDTDPEADGDSIAAPADAGQREVYRALKRRYLAAQNNLKKAVDWERNKKTLREIEDELAGLEARFAQMRFDLGDFRGPGMIVDPEPGNPNSILSVGKAAGGGLREKELVAAYVEKKAELLNTRALITAIRARRDAMRKNLGEKGAPK